MTNVNDYFGGKKTPKSPAKESNKFADSQRAIYLRNWCNAVKGRTSALAAIVFDHCPKKSNSLSHYKYGRFAIMDWMWEKIQKGIVEVEKAEKASNKVNKPSNTKSSFAHVKKEEKVMKKAANTTKIKDKVEKTTVIKERRQDAVSSAEYDDAKAYFEQNPGSLELFAQSLNRVVALEDFRTNQSLHLELAKFISSNLSQPTAENDEVAHLICQWLSTDRQRKLRLGNVVYVHNFSRAPEKDYTNTYFSQSMSQVERDGRYSVSLNVDTVKSIITKVNALIAENHPFAVAAGRVQVKGV